MCDLRVEKLKLNKIYMDVAKELAAVPDLVFDDAVAHFARRLQSNYQEFCSEACIDEKARQFAWLYCVHAMRAA
ncbi:MAG TPA: hypothetical protein VL492_09155 [Methylovirgula sp.]|nr:hypothetical protein [Methylovirgula sp.]